jgi:hypothetical protein
MVSQREDEMISTARSIAFTLATASALVAATAIAQSPYDGLWNVTIVTKAGNCEPTARYPLTVSDGKVSGSP